MDIRNCIKKKFYYPVLSSNSNDYSENVEFIRSIEILKNDGSRVTVRINAKITDEKIEKLIKEGFAEYVFIIEYPSDNFDKKPNMTVIKSNTGKEKITVKISDKVNFYFFVITVKNIESYTNENFGEEYEGIYFDIGKNSVLAIGDFLTIHYEIKKLHF